MPPRIPKVAASPRPLGRPKIMDPAKAVMAAPRIKPTSTRVYGKGGTPYSTGPDMGVRGASIVGPMGPSGFNPYGT